jgi:hypothetical protein
MKKIPSVAVMLALASSMALAQAGPANGNSQGNGRAMAHQKNERHPEIRKAQRKLEAAKDDLQHAAHDFGGHREKAIDLINQAENELNQALAYDKK